jgi:hypothetical protein
VTTPHIIHIEWDGPYSQVQLPTLTDRESDYGVYQIYGGHPVYGSSVLLYIGKADIQTFGKRIAQENWHFNRDADALQIYVGRLAGDKTPSDAQWSREIDLAEKLLIYAHATAVNAKSIVSIPDEALRDVHILNWGNHRDLMPEVSGARWTTKYHNMPVYAPYRRAGA